MKKLLTLKSVIAVLLVLLSINAYALDVQFGDMGDEENPSQEDSTIVGPGGITIVTTDWADNAQVYLYNVEAGLFLAAGNEWGTRATVVSSGYEGYNNGAYSITYNQFLGGHGVFEGQLMTIEPSNTYNGVQCYRLLNSGSYWSQRGLAADDSLNIYVDGNSSRPITGWYIVKTNEDKTFQLGYITMEGTLGVQRLAEGDVNTHISTVPAYNTWVCVSADEYERVLPAFQHYYAVEGLNKMLERAHEMGLNIDYSGYQALLNQEDVRDQELRTAARTVYYAIGFGQVVLAAKALDPNRDWSLYENLCANSDLTENDYLAYANIVYKLTVLKSLLDEAIEKGCDVTEYVAVYNAENPGEYEIDEAEEAVKGIILNHELEGSVDKATAENPIDLTRSIVNPTFDTIGDFTGWSYGFGSGGTKSTNAEVYGRSFDVYQDINNLPAGVYMVVCNGYTRYQNETADYNAWKTGQVSDTKIYLQSDSYGRYFTPVKHVSEGGSFTTVASQELTVNLDEPWGNITDNGSVTLYTPNTMAAADTYFHYSGEGGGASDRYRNEAFGALGEGDVLRIGVFNNKATGSDWSIFDDFQLFYLGNGADAYQKWAESVTKDYNLKFDDVYYGQQEKDDYDRLRETISTSDEKDAIYAAISEIDDAAEAVKTSMANYATYVEMLMNAQAWVEENMSDHENYEKLVDYLEAEDDAEWGFPNGPAKVIIPDYLQGGYAGTLSAEDIAMETEYLRALYDEVVKNTLSEGNDLTNLLVNPDFSTNDWTGWTRVAASGGNVAVGSQCAEAWNNSSFDIYQEVEDLPDGLYEISVQGFYRYGRGDNAYNAYLEQTVPYVKKGGAPVYVYMNNMSTPFVNVFDESEAEGFYSSDYYRSPNATYFPNGMSSSATAFADAMYTQKAYGLVKEGEKMRVGVKGSSNQLNDSWVIFDNFKLTYRGKDATAAGEVLKMKSEELGDFLELYGESKMTTPVREAVEDVYNRSMNVLDPAMNYDMLMETNEALVVARENIQKVDEYMDARDAYESVCTLLEQYDTDHEEDIWNNINSLNEDADASVDLDTEELSELISRMEALTEIILQKVNEIQQRPIEMNDLYYGYDDETMTATVISGENKYTGDVVIPEFVEYNGATYTVTAIGDEAFVDCDGLTSVTIPNSVTCIGGYAFMNCLSLTSITIPETVDSIAAGAFNCSGLKSIIIPDGVTTIGHNTFSCCYGLKSVEIPNSVTSIGYAAFSFCSSMNSIAIPEGVIYIGDNAFFECSGLTDVYCLAYNVPETTDEEPFDGVDLDYVTLHVPASSIDEYMETEPWSNFGNIVGDAVLEWVELISNGDCETATEHVFAVAKEIPVDGSNLHQARVVDGVGVDGSNGIEVRASDKLEYAWDNQFWIYEPYALPGGTRYIVEFDYKALRENDGYTPTEYHTTPSDWLAPGGIGSVYFTDEWQHFSYEGTVSTSDVRSIAFSLNDNNDANIYYFDNISFKVPANAIEDIEPIYVDDRYPVVDYDATGEDQYYFAEVDGIRYLVNASKLVATVSSGGSYVGSVTIPASFVMDDDTITVTEIGTFAFRECASLRSVSISEGVTRIRDHAFTGSTGLRLVTIPESVTSIGNNAFLNCTALKDVCCYAPSVPETDDYVFSGITLSSATLHVPESSIELYANDSQWGAFGNIVALTDEPIIYDDGSIAGIYYNFDAENMTAEVTSGDEKYVGAVVIPESVQYKGETYAVTAIGNEAFYSCSNLTSVTIPNSVTSIGEWAFVSCRGLSSMSIPASVTSIGECAFRYCVLSSIQVESGNPVYDSRDNCNAIIETASNTLIAGCENSFIPDGITSIGGAAFSGSRGLTSIAIPESVTSIGWTAFEDTGLSSVTIPNSVTTIGSYAFSGTPMTTVFIPKSVTSIGQGAFSGYGLTSIQLEEGNPVYDSRDNCNAIIETASNTLIEGWDFSTIPNSVTAIGEGAFVYCGRLTSIEIPNSVISIGSEAFWGCGLTSIIIPNSVKYIGGYAFYCPSLTDMYCYATKLPQTDWEIFLEVNLNDATLHVPATSLRAYSTTAPWSNFGNIVALDGGSSIIAGDANGDGNVNVFDVTATVNYILGSPVGTFVFDAADVNGDGTVNVFDVTKMVNIILGIDVVDDNESMQVVYQSDFKNFEEGSLPVGYSGEAQDSYRQSTSGNPLTGMAGAPRLMGSSTNANQGIYWGARSGSYGTLSFGKYYALGDYTDDDAVTDADALYLEPGEYFLNYRNASWDEAAGNMYMVGVYDADGMAVLEEYVTPTVTIAQGPGSGTIPVSKYQFTVETPGYYYVEFWGSASWNCWLLTSLSILKSESGTRANVRRAMADTTGMMLVENGNQEKNLVVDNAGQYVAMQFDVVVPTTQSVEEVTLNSTTDHVLSYQQVEPNRYRVIAFSMKNAGFEPTEDELVNISLSGVQKADIENAVFITTDGRSIDMSIVDEATGIETAEADENTDAIYSLSGVYMGTDINTLPKGTYIRNGKKFIVK